MAPKNDTAIGANKTTKKYDQATHQLKDELIYDEHEYSGSIEE